MAQMPVPKNKMHTRQEALEAIKTIGIEYVRHETFSTADGEITLTYPQDLKADDAKFALEWLELVRRKFERIANPLEQSP